MQFESTVISGRGRAAGELGLRVEELEPIIGAELFPGSLNLLLKDPVRFSERNAVRFDRGRRLLWPAELNGLRVWVYRWRECPLHVAEVLSTERLRSKFGLFDLQDVVLEVDDAQVDPVDRYERLAWAMVWSGRRRWAYTNKYYYVGLMRVCCRLGIAQKKNWSGEREY